jgi:hypothetical protein
MGFEPMVSVSGRAKTVYASESATNRMYTEYKHWFHMPKCDSAWPLPRPVTRIVRSQRNMILQTSRLGVEFNFWLDLIYDIHRNNDHITKYEEHLTNSKDEVPEKLTYAQLKNGIFWDITPCGYVRSDVSEKLSVSFIRVTINP